MGGQLRREPPLGYDEKTAFTRPLRKKGGRGSGEGYSLGKMLISIVVLSVLFSLFVVLAMAFSLSR